MTIAFLLLFSILTDIVHCQHETFKSQYYFLNSIQFNHLLYLKVQCLFFYLLISFTNTKYKQNCSFSLNKLVPFFYQRTSSTVDTQHSNCDAIFFYIFVLEAVRYRRRLTLKQSINIGKMASKSERYVFILDDIR